MLSLNFEIEEFLFQDIKSSDLDYILELYNESEEIFYATGIDRKLFINDIREKYLEVLVSSHEFFAGIFKKGIDKMIGVVKGRIDYENNEELWILSFFISPDYRNMGIGKRCINTLINYMMETYDIKKVFIGIIAENIKGIEFWKGIGFRHCRIIEKFICSNRDYEDFAIMCKDTD